MQVRTAEEALEVVGRAVARLAMDMGGVIAQAEARMGAAIADLEQAARSVEARLAARVAQAQQDPPRASAAEVARAEQDVFETRRRLAMAQAASQRLGAVRRRFEQEIAGRAPAAGASLARMRDDLGRYRAVATAGAPGQGGGAVTSASPSSGTSAPPVDPLAVRGLQEVDIAGVSTADNPLLDSGKGGATAADYAWAVHAWDTAVRPRVDAGATREEFAAKDAERRAVPFRRLADVYDLFLGDADRIVLSRRGDGVLTVTNGRHRIEAARKAGIRSLPARVFE